MFKLSDEQAAAFPPTDAELDAALNKGRDFARICAQGEEGVTPQLMIEYATGVGETWSFAWLMAALHVPFNEDSEKAGALRTIAAGMYRDKQIPRTAIMVSEAWLSHEPKGEPRHDPHRQEVITVFVATLDGRCRSGHFDLRRDAANRIDLLDFVTGSNARSPLLGKFFHAFAQECGFLRARGEAN